MPGNIGRLSVVATPIGNLSDLSARARQVLADADLILCEDTRQTAKLLQLAQISSNARLERCDAHQERKGAQRFLEALQEGKNVVLVSDAGTPGVSDPGAFLLSQAWEAGVSPVPVPGPSAVAALLSVAPFVSTPFVFRGFFPRKRSEQIEELQNFARSREWVRVSVWFESPQRILNALAVISETLPDANAWVGKELTKIHEKFFGGSVLAVFEQVRSEIDREGAVGEWSFALELSALSQVSSIESASWEKALDCLLKCNVSTSHAVKQISQAFGIPKNTVYEEALKKKV